MPGRPRSRLPNPRSPSSIGGDAVTYRPQPAKHLRPDIRACNSDHPQETACAESQPLHHHHVDSGAGILGLRQILIAWLVSHAKRPEILAPLGFETVDLAKGH